MKKIAAIFLLGLQLFNWFGYRLMIGCWQERAKNVLEARLDVDDYDQSQLISIKLPATRLAYFNPSPRFKRVDGSVEINGVEYKYVKRRLYNDTLEWLCLPDRETMKLRACANDIFRMTTGLQTATGKHTSAEKIPPKSFFTDSYVLTNGLVAPAPFVPISPAYGEATSSIPWIASGTDEQPPDGRV